MSDSILAAVVAQAKIADALRLAGIEPPAEIGKLIRCPLHDDQTASFSVQASGEGFKCHGCGAFGGVLELAVALSLAKDRGGAVDVLAAHYGISKAIGAVPLNAARRRSPQIARAVAAPIALPTGAERAALLDAVRGCRSIKGTPGAVYLKGRGFEPDAADACEVRYHPNWLGGGAAIVFGGRDSNGHLVAAQGRFLRPSATPKARSKGKIGQAVFSTPAALQMGKDGLDAPIAITEAPLDALALAVNGMPAIALFGASNRPEWLRAKLSFLDVVLATDADPAGEAAATSLRAWLNIGGTKERLLFGSSKDAAELLASDPAALHHLVEGVMQRARSRCSGVAA